jgi:high affinity Mn2+ porin
MFVNRPLLFLIAGALWATLPARPQDAANNQADERWNIHFQATSIGQHHGSFPSLYEGDNSLPSHPESRVSVTGTIFLSYRLNSWTEVVLNPEIAGGKGFGNVTGIAGFTNGEIPRVALATPTLYLARGYLRNTWALGPETEFVEAGPNQLADRLPTRRFTMITGKFAITDFFDNNRYSHDPRRQFMNWSLMSNGAWDYPADTRGYTIGTVQELTLKTWSLRAATVLEPTEANGPTFDTRVARNRGAAVESEKRYQPLGHPGHCASSPSKIASAPARSAPRCWPTAPPIWRPPAGPGPRNTASA